MSLNPNDTRRRGRSKSPGRRREDEEPRRERSRVRAPSPPSSKYAYEEEAPRSRGYDYDDRDRRDVIEAEPRGYDYEPRDPRESYGYNTSGGRTEYGSAAYGRDERKENADGYSMPGAFTSAEDDKPKYATASSANKREKDYYKDSLAYEPKEKREKDYYKDLAYGDEPYEKKDKDSRYSKDKYGKEESKYGETLYGGGERERHGRGTSPLPPTKKERGRYEDDDRTQYDKYGRATSPISSSRKPTRYDAEEPPRKDKYGRDTSPMPPSRKSRYDDESPPRKDKYKRDTSPMPPSRKSKYDDDSPPRKDKYGRDTSPPSSSRKSKYDKDEDTKRLSRYEDDKHKYGGAEVREEKKYSDDKYGRERGASFNIAAGSHALSGGYNVSHGPPEKSSYVQPPSPADFAPPGALGRPSAQTTSGGPLGSVTAYEQSQQYSYGQPVQQQQPYQIQQTTPIPYASQPGQYAPTPAYATPGQQYGAPPPNPYQTDPRYAQPQQGAQPVYSADPRYPQSQIVTVEPGRRQSTLGAPTGSSRREPSPGPGLRGGMHSLSVSTGHHGSASMSLANAPGSPLLESYHGTYQSISPMPSPLMIAATAHGDVNIIQALEPDSSSDSDSTSGGLRKKKRNARFHDPAEEAKILAVALRGDKKGPDVDPLIDILPGLTHDQMLDLRYEYKKIVKTGSEKKGVNIAKHIKSRLKEEDPSLMKACYACALGKWESEAYWSNFWYQGEKSRRELLIESLMGRTNQEIREIKDGFADKKYKDSLQTCMRTELKEDKFKKAVLLVLEEKKQDDRPGYPLDRHLVEDDVRDLYKAVKSEKGGETAMINIIVVRNDAHLREVLRIYESTYRSNFPREMLKRSGNLVVSSIRVRHISILLKRPSG